MGIYAAWGQSWTFDKKTPPWPPGLRDVDPNFGEEHDEAKHGKVLRDELKLDHLTKFQREILTAVIKKYWRVFSKQGVTTPVKDYECEIDTVDAKPIRRKNPTVGPHETTIIKKAIGWDELKSSHHMSDICYVMRTLPKGRTSLAREGNTTVCCLVSCGKTHPVQATGQQKYLCQKW